MQEDHEEHVSRRPAWLIVLIGLVVLICLIGGGAVILPMVLGESEIAGEQPGTQPPVQATLTLTPSPTPDGQATEEATAEPQDGGPAETTPEATEEPQPAPSATPIAPTDTPTPVIIVVQRPPVDICGDGVCGLLENSDFCPQDCGCRDDGVCSPEEGFNCSDCLGPNEPPSTTCGSPCGPGAACGGGLTCTGGICWSAFVCQGIVPPDPDVCVPIAMVCNTSVCFNYAGIQDYCGLKVSCVIDTCGTTILTADFTESCPNIEMCSNPF
ncbi:MAG: hypothetical protein IT326_07730 [Anaerolineae bacterium]|nr:hypothetical protein [Anaerolineae bacterium]